ncbi:MAG: hypothetical protein R3C05_07440 [Pirellulaceae bacterium]
MAMKFKSGLLVGGLVVAAALTNPTKDEHARTLAEETLAPLSDGGRNSTLARIGSAFAQSFSDAVVDYHNYLVFSTTTRPESDEQLTIGCFRYVHVIKRE